MSNTIIDAGSWGLPCGEHPAVTPPAGSPAQDLDAFVPGNDGDGTGRGLGVVLLGALAGMVGAITMFASGGGLLKAILIYSLGGTLTSLCVVFAALVLSVGNSDL